ncbi:MAG: ABC transporter substrate-binding protein [Clostridia bacterium]|nr:ABC transporter substrate-binding protein [Clostridia bacterium]
MTCFVRCTDGERESGDGLKFTDALGREVLLPENPKRTAALLGSFADAWMLAGGELCAASEDAWQDFALPLDGVVNIGGAHSPSLELLVSANPDFVIASASTASNVAMRDSLESMGITVAYFDVDNFEDYLKMLQILTRITGRPDLYVKNGANLKKEIEEIKERYKALSIPSEERKILLLRAASSFVKAKGSAGTVLGEMLQDIGCVNIADSESSVLESLSLEAIIRENPYRIFIVTMGDDTQKAKESVMRMISENPAWQSLDAVKENRIYFMDKTLFNLKPNDRWSEAYEILYKTLTEK